MAFYGGCCSIFIGHRRCLLKMKINIAREKGEKGKEKKIGMRGRDIPAT